MIGKTFSRYRMLEKLGEGGMGVVYRAEDTKLDRPVALKFLSPQALGEEEEGARFVLEAKAAAALSHPNICHVYEIDEAEGRVFIAFEYVEGRSLKELIESGRLEIRNALDIAVQIAKGLRAAHERGIVHRDVKPANVMVTPDRHVKITDFGLAKLPGRAKVTRTGAVMGTLAYMSPEQIRGEDVGSSTDIWALGVVLFEMLCGRLPFWADYDAALMYSVLNEEAPSLSTTRSDVPGGLEDILLRALDKSPANRYRDGGEILRDLESLRAELKGETAERSTAVGDRPPSVAVLPFRDMSPQKDQDYFCEGMAEEIINTLTRIGKLRVIARTSAFAFKDKQEDVREIGKKLGVDTLLEGGVRKDGDRLRITAQLVKVSDGSHLWSESYDRVLEDIFAVQSEIADQVSRRLEVALTDAKRQAMEEKPTESLDAYQAYLRGLCHGPEVSVRREDIQVAIRMFERATELDSEFAPAWAKLSLAHGAYYHYGHDHTQDRLRMAEEAAEKARRLDPDHPEVHRAIGYYHYRGRRDYKRALEEFSAALRDRPGYSRVLADIGYVLRRLGRWDESISKQERAVELDPRNARALHQLAASYLATRDYERADVTLDRSISLAPDQYEGYQTKVLNYWLWRGDTHESRRILEKIPRRDDPSVVRFWYDQEFFSRDWQAALDRVSSTPVEVFEGQNEYCPKSLLECWCYLRMEKPKPAKASAEASLRVLEKDVLDNPEDRRILSAIGLTCAALGRKHDAMRAGERAVEVIPVSEDPISGPGFIQDLALTYTQVGEYERALERIEYLLSIPCALSGARLRLDPMWDPLRGHPRFERLSGGGRGTGSKDR
jgi:non-specific serine/threonine protein kinase